MSLISRLLVKSKPLKPVIFSNNFVRHQSFKPCFPADTLQTHIANMSSTPNYEFLSVSTPKEHVFHVELNRPDKLNAINYSLFSELKSCFELMSESEDCRIVVLSGAGRFFTAGIDLQDVTQNMVPKVAQVEDVARKAKIFRPFIRLYQDSMSSLEQCRKPVIAAVHSGCIGAGVDLITAADMRFCSKDAYFQVKEVDIGMAADVGTLQRLPKVIGSDSLARELCYTCRKFPAAEALDRGLVSKVYDTKDELIQGVIGLAEEISKKSPVAVQTTKASLVYSRDHTVQEGLDHIGLLNQMMLQSEDLVNATMGQLTKDPNVVFSKL
ncbi:hypothetical protein HUJ05_005055 [Dendroctonus ponderosae]|nr:hypothetical protein HUJ05_005055 [Dendroctonus ponderosae]